MNGPLRVLYADSEFITLRGGAKEHPWTYPHIWEPLRKLAGVDARFFDLDDVHDRGRGTELTRALAERVRAERPDILFVMMTHDLDRDIIRSLRGSGTLTVALYTDEDTDFFLRSVDWIGAWDWVVTPYPPAYEQYERRGQNVIGMNWAASSTVFHPVPVERQDIDVSFVGAAKDERRAFVRALEARGVRVECFGGGWENGAVSFEEMVRIFNRSRINLNLSFGKDIMRWRTLARLVIDPVAERPGAFRFAPHHIVRNARTIWWRRHPHQRMRPFEIAMAGGFVLSNGDAAFFGEPFAPGREIVYYNGVRDAAEKVRYYLGHEDERAAIQRAGHARVMADHTYERRLADLFAFLGEVRAGAAEGVRAKRLP